MTAPKLQPPRRGLPAMHPGELLREEVLPALKASGVPKVKVAEHLRVSRSALENILTGASAVTPDMALRLGKLCGNGPDLWLALQRTWDLEQARGRIGDELDQIPTLAVA